MAVPKLIIQPKKYTEESAVISMRLPKDMIRNIDATRSWSSASSSHWNTWKFQNDRTELTVHRNKRGGERACLLSNAKCVVEIWS